MEKRKNPKHILENIARTMTYLKNPLQTGGKVGAGRGRGSKKVNAFQTRSQQNLGRGGWEGVDTPEHWA